MLTFDQNLSRTSHLTWNKSRSLYTLAPLLLSRTHLLLLYPMFTLLQPCCSPCCFCRCMVHSVKPLYVFLFNHPLSGSPVFRSLCKYLLFSENFLDHLYLNYTISPASIHTHSSYFLTCLFP